MFIVMYVSNQISFENSQKKSDFQKAISRISYSLIWSPMIGVVYQYLIGI